MNMEEIFTTRCPQCLEKTIPVGLMVSFLTGRYSCKNCGFLKAR